MTPKKHVVEFYVVPAKDALVKMPGYKVGSKEFSKFSDLVTAVSAAFGKTMEAGSELLARITWRSKNRGDIVTDVTADTFSESLTTIAALMDSEQITLEELLEEE